MEEIVARVNNSIVTRADLERSKEQWQEDSAKAKSDGAQAPKEQDLLRDLIDQQLLLQKGTELGVSADTDVVKRLDQIRQQMHAESMEDLEKAAQAQGVSWEDFKQNLKNGIITQKVIQQEVGGHIIITQQEIQQFYDQHKAEIGAPEQVRLSEILISTQKSAVKTEKWKNCPARNAGCRSELPPPRKRPTRSTNNCKRAGDFAAWRRPTPTVRLRRRVATWNTSSAERSPRNSKTKCLR